MRKTNIEQQRRREKQYRESGMTEEQIAEMNAFDREQFNSNRRFFEHEESVDMYYDDSDETMNDDESAEHFAVYDEHYDNTISWWIGEMENPQIILALKKLTSNELYTVFLYGFYRYNLSEIAIITGVNASTVMRRINKFKRMITK